MFFKGSHNMSNINKILITIVSCVFMVCVASVSIVGIVTSNKNETTTAAADTQPQQGGEGTTAAGAPVASGDTQGTSQTTTVKPQDTSSTASAQPSTTQTTASPAVTGSLESDILGSWTDSAGMSGYEFLEGGKFNWTYVDLAGFGVPFNGKTSGVYTLEGDTLTIKYSIYSATIKKMYRVSVSQNELSMYDLEEHETSTYVRVVTQ